MKSVEQAVLGDLPGLGQVGFNAAVLVHTKQRFEHQGTNPRLGRTRPHQGIHQLHLLADGHRECTPTLGFTRGAFRRDSTAQQ